MLTSPQTRTAQGQAVTAGLEEKTINHERILEAAAKHMTEPTHGDTMSEGGRDGRKQRGNRGTEMIQATHLLT